MSDFAVGFEDFAGDEGMSFEDWTKSAPAQEVVADRERAQEDATKRTLEAAANAAREERMRNNATDREKRTRKTAADRERQAQLKAIRPVDFGDMFTSNGSTPRSERGSQRAAERASQAAVNEKAKKRANAAAVNEKAEQRGNAVAEAREKARKIAAKERARKLVVKQQKQAQLEAECAAQAASIAGTSAISAAVTAKRCVMRLQRRPQFNNEKEARIVCTLGTAVEVALPALCLRRGGVPTSCSAAGLPAGLCIGLTTGTIAGEVVCAGMYKCSINVANMGGSVRSSLLLSVPLLGQKAREWLGQAAAACVEASVLQATTDGISGSRGTSSTSSTTNRSHFGDPTCANLHHHQHSYLVNAVEALRTGSFDFCQTPTGSQAPPEPSKEYDGNMFDDLNANAAGKLNLGVSGGYTIASVMKALALISVCGSDDEHHRNAFLREAAGRLDEYKEAFAPTRVGAGAASAVGHLTAASWDPIFLLAAARMAHLRLQHDLGAQLMLAFRHFDTLELALEQRWYGAAAQGKEWEFDDDAVITKPEPMTTSSGGALHPVGLRAAAASGSESDAEKAWAKVVAAGGVSESVAAVMSEIFNDLVGLEGVKAECVKIYQGCARSMAMDEASRIPDTLNFAFMGNPGTGKTTVARVFGKLLHAIGARRSDHFAELKAQQALSVGEEAFGELIAMMLDPSAANQSASSAGGGVTPASSKVIPLNDSNFDSSVLNSDGVWMVAFMSPTCANCKSLTPEWEAAAAQMQYQVKFGAVDVGVDGTKCPRLSKDYAVSAYPTIKYFAGGKKVGPASARQYTGLSRTAKDLVAFAGSGGAGGGAGGGGGSSTQQSPAQKKATKLLEKAMGGGKGNGKPGGVLFIDEAHMLKPKTSVVGAAIFNHIMDAAEDHREDLTIILAGYKDDIEQELYAFNVGMKGRFDDVVFEDYAYESLLAIWNKLLDKVS
jgi:thiol-disulfide isomerase/thioredoxin